MQTTSSVYRAILQEENYHFEVKLNIADSDYGEDVIFSMKSDSRLFESSPTIGGTYSGTLEFSLLGDGADIPRMAVVKPYYRAVGASQTSEWLQKGEYYIDTRSVSQNEGGIVVFNAFCYDAMLKANAPYASSTLSWPATPKQVVNEIAGKMGVTITSYASTVLNLSYISIPMPVQYNMREVLGFIAAAYGGNWFINYEGQLDFKELYMMGLGSAQLAVGTNVSSLNVSPNRGAYTKVILDVDDETAYESGTDETNVLEATCPYATQAVADRVLSELTQYSFLYKPFEAIGCWTNPAVELTDNITFTDTSVLRPVCARTINFGPAMVMDLTAPNDNDIDHEYAFESPTERNYKRTTARVINQLNVNAEGISLVSQKLNNIGGRNYVKHSDDPSTWTQYEPSNYFIAVVPLYVNMTSGKKYTITIWGDAPTRSDKTDTWYSVYWGGGAVWLGNIKINGGKGSISFTAPSSGSGIQNAYLEIYNTPYSGGVGTTYGANIRAMKLEEGEVSTDWTPAPEDKVGNDEIISKINVSPENITISASKVDLQGYVTFTNLSTSGQTAINGANITTGLIQDQAGKNSWNLNTGALTITDGSVNIATSSETQDKIQLTYERSDGMATTARLSSGEFALERAYAGGGTIGLKMQASALLFTDSNGVMRNNLNTSGLAFYYDTRKLRSNYSGDVSQGIRFYGEDGITKRLTLYDEGLTFRDSSGNVTASYPASWMIRAKDFALGSQSITSGTPGTRAAQKTIDATLSGYDVLFVRLHSVNDSSLANVVPFIGSPSIPNTVYINYYRASGSSGDSSVTIRVFYIKSDAYSLT